MNGFKLDYQLVESLPQTSWCARVERGVAEVTVFHGSSVETHPGFFIEGAWDGPFLASRLSDATVLCGTGAELGREGIRFYGATDGLSVLFSIRKDGLLFVSNSPVFVMRAARERPNDAYPFYSRDFLRIKRRGLKCVDRRVRLASGNVMEVYLAAILQVGKEGALGVSFFPKGREPTDFRSYHALLANRLRRVIENATDRARSRALTSVAAVSKGYDSCAAAALARGAGCSKAFTFTDSRRHDPNSDSGAENAAFLGLECVSVDRWDYLTKDGGAEAECGLLAYACNAPYVGLDGILEGALVVGGHLGDNIWSVSKRPVFARWSTVFHGFNQVEWRLRVGCVCIAPAGIGAQHDLQVHRISVSREMEPWSLPGDYNRPIPRRIAEEAGIPRKAFGMSKATSAQAFLGKTGGFSEKGLESYCEFTSRRFAELPRRTYFYRSLSAAGYNTLLAGLSWVRNKGVIPVPWWGYCNPLRPIPWKFSFTFQWTFDVLKERYRVSENSERQLQNESTRRSSD